MSSGGELFAGDQSGGVEMGQGKGWNRLTEMSEGVRTFISERRGIGGVANPDGIEDDEERLFHLVRLPWGARRS